MFRFYFSFLLVLAMCISGNAYAEADLYTYTKITCRPDLQYLQIDAVTEDISEKEASMPSQFYLGEEGVLFCYWSSIKMSFLCDKEKVKNRYLTNSELRNLLVTQGGGGIGYNFTDDQERMFKGIWGLEKRPVMTREQRIDYIIEEQHKGLKKPYQCKFNDKVVTVEEKIYPKDKWSCGYPSIALLIYEGNEQIYEHSHFIDRCDASPQSHIYNNLGGFTSCNTRLGCTFIPLEKIRPKNHKQTKPKE